MFTKKSGVVDYDPCRDTRYVCEYVGAYNDALTEGKEAVRTAIANKALKDQAPAEDTTPAEDATEEVVVEEA